MVPLVGRLEQKAWRLQPSGRSPAAGRRGARGGQAQSPAAALAGLEPVLCLGHQLVGSLNSLGGSPHLQWALASLPPGQQLDAATQRRVLQWPAILLPPAAAALERAAAEAAGGGSAGDAASWLVPCLTATLRLLGSVHEQLTESRMVPVRQGLLRATAASNSGDSEEEGGEQPPRQASPDSFNPSKWETQIGQVWESLHQEVLPQELLDAALRASLRAAVALHQEAGGLFSGRGGRGTCGEV